MTSPPQVQYFPPPEQLAPFVSIFAFTEMAVTEANAHLDIFPIGYSVLSFSLDDLVQDFLDINKTLPRFNLTGQITRFYQLGIKPGRYRMVSAILKPYGAYRFFNFPQNTVLNKFADVAAMVGNDMQHFNDKMFGHYANPVLAIQLLEQWLTERLEAKVNLEKLATLRAACDVIDGSEGRKTIKEVYAALGISKSTLERFFLEIVGLTPKMYSRIVRFNKVYQVLQHGQYDTWQDVIYKYNFYDQAHFIKDFKNFFNKTPSEVHKSHFNSAELLGSAG